MKKFISISVSLVLTLAILFSLAGCGNGKDKKVLNVYNWGEYISDGSEDSLDTISAFEDWYKQTYNEEITVNYSTFPSNEDMYNKLSTGAVSYDVIFPSDYMIERMIKEDLLEPINFENIPNYKYINDHFKNLYYDPENIYSIPYTYGICGVIYDANKVDKADIGGWELMWNEKYAGKILQFNNSRDAFGTAMYMLDIDVNTNDKNEWKKAADSLIKQRPLVKSYVMDEVFNMMESGEASIASYYVGDYFLMRDEQAEGIDLQFYYPEKTNFFVDAMCIPKSTQNKELAEIFINWMLTAEPAIANAEMIGYASPNSLVYKDEGYKEEMGNDAYALLYPDLGDFSNTYNEVAFRNLTPELLDYLNTLWETVKVN